LARPLFWPCVAATLAGGAFFAVAWLRFATYHSTAYDLAFFDQMIWNSSQGSGLQSSFLGYDFFGQHFEPALYAFVPLYRLHATPLWLLGAEALALGGAVVPLWALARRWLGGGLRPAIVCAAYVLQIGVARAVGFDFHTEALAVPFVFLALLGAARGSSPMLLLCGVAPMLCKEDGALVTLGIAVIALTVHRRRAGLALGGIAVAGGAVIVLGVMPHLRGGAAQDLAARYAYLGDSPGSVLLHLVTRPQVWLRHLVAPPAGPALLLALAGVGFLPLLRPVALLACMPALLLPLLADDPYQGGLRLHYGLQATPLLVCAAMLGWQRARVLARRYPLFALAPPAALLGGAVATWLALSPLPGGHGPDALSLGGLQRSAQIDALLAQIPPNAPVAASGNLLTHLAERSVMAEWPSHTTPDFVAIDDGAQVTAQSRAAGYASDVARLRTQGYVAAGRAGGVTLWQHQPH
jgi:uncharacterized membrane protein